MIIDDAAYRTQFEKLNNTLAKPVHFNYTGVFLDENNFPLEVLNIVSMTSLADYENHFTTFTSISIQVFKSIYFKLLNVNRRKLKFKLTLTPTSVTGQLKDVSKSFTYVYNAFLTDNTNEVIKTTVGGYTGTAIDDLGGLMNLDVQLVELGLMEFKVVEEFGTPRNINVRDLLVYSYLHPVEALGNKGFKVDVIEPDNVNKVFQILVPQGIRLPDFAKWLQEEKGVYSAGIASFCYNGCWYIYPPYDVTRFDKSNKTLTIINVPRNEMMGNTNSYILEDHNVFVFTTGDTTHLDDTEHVLNRVGTGFKTAKTHNILDDFAESANGKMVIPEGRNVLTVGFEQREGDFDDIKTPTLLTSNPWLEASKVIAAYSDTVEVFWENSNQNLLYPGMPVKFIYKYLGKPHLLYGTLAGHTSEVKTHMPSVTDTRYVSNSKLKLFLSKRGK